LPPRKKFGGKIQKGLPWKGRGKVNLTSRGRRRSQEVGKKKGGRRETEKRFSEEKRSANEKKNRLKIGGDATRTEREVGAENEPDGSNQA